MSKTLALTSPHMHGEDVRTLQDLLKHNWTKQDFLQGIVDGDFGPETARGCTRAKYWLGYTLAMQKPFAAGTLQKYLALSSNVPPANLKRRKARLKQAKLKPLRVKALERAGRDLGMKENPAGSNRCPISKRWGMVGPWCAMAVSEWYIDAGSKAFRERVDWAYVPFMLATAEHGQSGLAIIRPRLMLPGDPVCFDWDDDGVADHTGLFKHWIDASAGTFRTREGNTAVGNDSNGGEVMERDRSVSQLATFNRAPVAIRIGR